MKNFYLTLLIIFSTFSVFSQVVVTFSGGQGGTWDLPCGVTDITVEVWAAGGGGGKGQKASSGGGGAGGGGGEYLLIPLSGLSAGTQFNYNVGVGGSGSS